MCVTWTYLGNPEQNQEDNTLSRLKHRFVMIDREHQGNKEISGSMNILQTVSISITLKIRFIYFDNWSITMFPKETKWLLGE